MTLTELADRVGMTLANLSILKTGKARAILLCREVSHKSHKLWSSLSSAINPVCLDEGRHLWLTHKILAQTVPERCAGAQNRLTIAVQSRNLAQSAQRFLQIISQVGYERENKSALFIAWGFL